MDVYSVYVCEKCGKESGNRKEIELCETIHMGLNSLEERKIYDNLKSIAESCGRTVSYSNNDKTRDAFDKAIENLVDFEKEYNMKV